MEKKIAIVNKTPPIGQTTARESLDLTLALSAYNESLSVFFIGDAVYQLYGEHNAERVLQKNFQPMLAMLELYDVENIYVCQASLLQRQIALGDLVIDATALTRQQISEYLAQQDQIVSL